MDLAGRITPDYSRLTRYPKPTPCALARPGFFRFPKQSSQ